MKRRTRKSLTKVYVRLEALQKATFVTSQKLRAWGALLERQGRECEGFVELEGLGIELTEFSGKLDRISHSLDIQGIRLLKVLSDKKTVP